ncbi:coiled coil AKL20 [Puccinia sorghi]|uniref:Coiled coil AKL20 n=1 Tax=Puccinia sorghi TaxID=27349 RepID=A0A0L6VIR2_9BASI|nr:coiled coil AKL20 [Puccinia sorghi]
MGPLHHWLFQCMVICKIPPWISKQILDAENLLWESFGTAIDFPTFHDHQDSFWIDGICNELNPDEVKMILCLCLYKLQYKDTITTKETSKNQGINL